MTILSLQAIIQKYGAHYGIDPKAALKAPAKDAGANAASAANANGSPAKDSQQTDAGTKKIPLADSLNLSPAAKDFLAAHTGPLGKFEMPNVMNDFFDALDGSGQSGSGSGTGNSLLDFLSASNNGNQANASSGSLFNFQNPLGTDNTPPKSLLDFL